jgi:hypothetical protein
METKDFWLSQTWGKLKLDPNQELPDEWKGGTQKKYWFLCTCTRKTLSCFSSVVKGDSKSCGKCNYKSQTYWLSQTWGDLRLDPNQELPDEWPEGSRTTFSFLCKCTRSCLRKLGKMSEAGYSSCGHCNDKAKEYWLAQTWGDLRLDPNQELPEEWGSASNRQLGFICSCKRHKTLRFDVVIRGDATTCARCSYRPKDYWLSQTWGKLKLDPNQNLPDEWGQGSPLSFTVRCDCARQFDVTFYNLTNESTISCGECEWQPKEYWLAQTWGKLKLDPNQELPDKWGRGFANKLWFICGCGKRKQSTWYRIHKMKSCGCVGHGKSKDSPAYKIYEFVTSLSLDAKFSYWFKKSNGNRVEYDIYLPSKHLAIEYHGLIWHSERYSTGARDHEKFLLAKSRGDRLIQIYSDEWRDKQEIMKEMLASLIAPSKGKGVLS